VALWIVQVVDAIRLRLRSPLETVEMLPSPTIPLESLTLTFPNLSPVAEIEVIGQIGDLHTASKRMLANSSDERIEVLIVPTRKPVKGFNDLRRKSLVTQLCQGHPAISDDIMHECHHLLRGVREPGHQAERMQNVRPPQHISPPAMSLNGKRNRVLDTRFHGCASDNQLFLSRGQSDPSMYGFTVVRRGTRRA
jgi:hypothetical protein